MINHQGGGCCGGSVTIRSEGGFRTVQNGQTGVRGGGSARRCSTRAAAPATTSGTLSFGALVDTGGEGGGGGTGYLVLGGGEDTVGPTHTLDYPASARTFTSLSVTNAASYTVPTGETIIFTLLKNGSPTDLTVTFNDASGLNLTDTGSATFAEGDTFDLRTVASDGTDDSPFFTAVLS